MRITLPLGTLVVSDDSKIPLTLTNPFIHDQGSHSLPFTAPWCEHNLKILGNPENHFRANAPTLQFECKVETALFNDWGTLEVVNISHGSSIELCIKLREGGFWDWAKSTQLRDITIPHSALDLSLAGFQSIKNTYLNNVWPTVDFAFVPIATDLLSLDNYENTTSYNQWCDRKLCISDYILWNNPGDLYRNDEGRTSRLAPQVYLNAVLLWIGSTFGYRINDNFLASTDELKSALLINKAYNTGIFGGFNIIPKYLLPKVTVMDLIQSVELCFGCRFVIDSKTRSINIVSLKTKLTAPASKVDGRVTVQELINGESLEYSLNRVTSPYAAVNDRAVGNFFFNFTTENGPVIAGKVYQSAANPNYETYPSKIVYSVALQAYFYFEWIEGSEDWEYIPRCIHSHLYNRKVNPNLESSKIAPKSYFAPMVPITCRQFYKNGSTNAYFDYTLIVPQIIEWDWLFSNEDGFIGDNEQNAPVVFAFNRGKIVNIEFPVELFGITEFDLPWASTDVYDKEGTKIPTASIALRFAGDYSLHDNFYKEFEIFLNNRLAKLSVDHVNMEDFLNRSIVEPVLVDGVRLMISAIDVTVGLGKTEIDSIEAYPVKPYIP